MAIAAAKASFTPRASEHSAFWASRTWLPTQPTSLDGIGSTRPDLASLDTFRLNFESRVGFESSRERSGISGSPLLGVCLSAIARTLS